MASKRASEALAQRVQDFAKGQEIENLDTQSSQILHDIGQHASAWLVLDCQCPQRDELRNLATQCALANPYFRCLVIGADADDAWPAWGIHLPAHALSTTILDRLRLESHALRIQSRRRRTLEQLRQRPLL